MKLVGNHNWFHRRTFSSTNPEIVSASRKALDIERHHPVLEIFLHFGAYYHLAFPVNNRNCYRSIHSIQFQFKIHKLIGWVWRDVYFRCIQGFWFHSLYTWREPFKLKTLNDRSALPAPCKKLAKVKRCGRVAIKRRITGIL